MLAPGNFHNVVINWVQSNTQPGYACLKKKEIVLLNWITQTSVSCTYCLNSVSIVYILYKYTSGEKVKNKGLIFL